MTSSDTADRRAPASACKVPAGEFDQLVRERFAGWLRDPRSLLNAVAGPQVGNTLPALLAAGSSLANEIEAMPISDLRCLLLDLGTQVQIDHDQVLIGLAAHALAVRLGQQALDDLERRCTIVVAAALTRRGQELRLAFAPDDRDAPAQVDTKLVGLIAKAHAAHRQLLTGGNMSKAERGHLTRLAKLTTLAPDIIVAILDGRQPVQLTARTLLRLPDLPLAWTDQRRALGFG